MANIITTLALEMNANWYVSKKLNSIGRVGENTVTKLIIEPTEIINNVTYEIEIMSADGSKNVAELTIEGSELYLILTANMLTVSGITKMQVRGLFTDGSIKKSNIFELKVNRSISATEHYEEYAVTIFDQLVQDCRDIIEGAESYVVRAETAAVNAEAYEQSASASAEAASGYADNASGYADNAASSATAASNSATSATTAASNAASSEASAANSATSASTSATNAANSATSAATSATNAHNSEVNASNSETNASTSATEAAASAESIAASVAQINENTYRINDLEAIIAGYQEADLPTGAIATVADGTALLMPSLKIGIEPVQSGSGDPSPTNIRPISGWTEANVVVSPTTSAEDGTTYTIEFRDGDNPLTVYGGTLDVTSGELVVTHVSDVLRNLTATSIYTVGSKSVVKLFKLSNTSTSCKPNQYHGAKSNIAKELPAYFAAPRVNETLPSHIGTFAIGTGGDIVAVYDEDITMTEADYISKYENTQVWYPLATPTTYQLTPTQIRTLVGNNNIWADTGDIIEGKYFKSPS